LKLLAKKIRKDVSLGVLKEDGGQTISEEIFCRHYWKNSCTVFIEKHSKKRCECSYCEDTKGVLFRIRIPKSKHHGWFSVYLKTFKYAYYVRFTLLFPDPLDTLTWYVRRKYKEEDIEVLKDILENQAGPLALSRNANKEYPYVRRNHVPDIIRFLKMKMREVPLHLNHELIEIRGFAQWRLKISK